uniref:NADH-ubiquinone oxidoreductase chain 6 n=1 Tax=Gondwanalimnadia sp. MT-2020 TaxID=2731355 RepID=A0A6M4SRZ2_9CRUS|nr:NADH dehydrogenase subunit 6 [Gondwanalimnadia sp. MT-2020]
MLLSFCLSLFLTLIVVFIFLNHPLALALNLFFQTLCITVLSTSLLTDPWFSYILFLVFLGGLLVIFAYVSTFAANEKFALSSFSFMCCLVFSLVTFYFCFYGNYLSWKITYLFNFIEDLYSLTTSLVLYSVNIGVLCFLVGYLLLALLIVVRLNRMSDGPLRSF